MHAQLKDISVQFGTVKAVDGVSLAFEPGQIHAVLGENGAGKSTLMNVLFGLLRPVDGTIEIDGETVSWSSPQDAIKHGLGMVHQHFMLQRQMTVLENIVLCSEPCRWFGIVDFSAARKKLREGAMQHGISLELDAMVETLSVGQRQVVEILKVLYRDAKMLILDEPTAVLTPQEKDNLFGILKSFAAAGKSIVLITHKLDEVMEIADRVSVMRAGRLISSGSLSSTTKDRIAHEIVGSELAPPLKGEPRRPGEVVLSVKELSVGSAGSTVGPLSFELRRGEIIGIAGVSGNGQAELVQAITGLQTAGSGEIELLGQRIELLDIATRRRIGLSYIPEDRQNVGLALAASVSDNASAGRDDVRDYSRGPFLDRAKMTAFARSLIDRYRIRVGGPGAAADTMSGGNKQKLVVGRELSRGTPLIVAENPTWGVDIGAIDLIHRELLRMRDLGHAILLVSTELDEILRLADRIFVMYSGRLSEPISAIDASREHLGQLMTSQSAAALREIA